MSKAAVTQVVKILVPAGKATPSPPVGPALGARGVKAMDFCKEFNARTAHLKPTVPVPTSITINPDRTFSFSFRTPPVAHLLRTAASIDKGSTAPPSHTSRTLRAATSGSTAGGQAPASVAAKGGATSVPGGGFVGKVSVKQVYEIAKIKMEDEDLKVLGLERVARSVVGSARSMGLEVVP
ncbi:60s ribosomal protein l19, mitochondrial precursor [Filobasidium floriforme]|uniref:60s ribosomal protein l19, mitochondrial precursor n=1 Tax=Filobasidium floriforme TaxID=5210 RepID=UPI001E8E7FC1|nr:60s ribosomal protein l19, mitochondrial precursor [Filobasidium floriforme]KAH8083002.1 60s ribosomal protein l19, mitochondrial precursor [Filobasidium floriforme]